MLDALRDFRAALNSAFFELAECLHTLKLKTQIPLLQQPDFMYRCVVRFLKGFSFICACK
jgi:hypothetical protein